MKYITLLYLSIILLVSCTEKKPSATYDALMQSVMTVHDEVMPLMGDIMKSKKQLASKISELQAAGDEANTMAIANLQQATAKLDSASDAMMAWMHEFNDDFTGMNDAEITQYLTEEKAEIEKVGVMTKQALQDATAILQQ